MSLDVTLGTSGTGHAPPPTGPAGPVGAGHPASDPAALFTALLLNGGQKMPDPPGKAVRPTALSHTKAPAHHPSHRPDPPKHDPPKHDPPKDYPNPPAAALTTMLMALAAPKTIPDTPLPPVSPGASGVGSAPAVTTTTIEAMDTVPAPAPSAPSAKAEPPGSELLSQSSIEPAALSVPAALAAPAPTPSAGAPATPAATLPASSTSLPVFDGPAPVAAVLPAHVSAMPDVGGVSTASVVAPPAALPVTAAAPSAPPTALALNDVRPDVRSVNSPAPAVTPQPAVQAALPTPAAPLPLTAQVIATVQVALQNGPAPANNTGRPEAKADETPSTTGAVTEVAPAPLGGVGQALAEVINPVAANSPTKQAVVTLAETQPAPGSVSGPAVRDEDAGRPTGQAKVAETVLPLPFALDVAAQTQTAPAPHRAPAALTTTDRAQVIRQISDGAQRIVQQPSANGVRELNLQLHPHDWGQIRLSVRMTPAVGADGAVATSVIAHVVADSPVVKAALETHAAELRQTLHEAGLKLDRLSVTVQAPDAGPQSGPAGQEQRPFGQDGGAWAGQGAAAPNGGAGDAGQTGNGGNAFSSGFGDGRGGQTYGRPAQPQAAWADDAGAPETTPTNSSSARLPVGRWDSRA